MRQIIATQHPSEPDLTLTRQNHEADRTIQMLRDWGYQAITTTDAGEIHVLNELYGEYRLEVEGMGGSLRVAPFTPGQVRNWACWWEPCEPTQEPLFRLWNQYGEWRSHGAHSNELLTVVREELAQRGFLGMEAMQATGADRPVYRW